MQTLLLFLSLVATDSLEWTFSPPPVPVLAWTFDGKGEPCKCGPDCNCGKGAACDCVRKPELIPPPKVKVRQPQPVPMRYLPPQRFMPSFGGCAGGR